MTSDLLNASVYKPALVDTNDDSTRSVISPGLLGSQPGVLLVPGGDVNDKQLLAVTVISSVFDMADFVNPTDSVILSIADGNTLRCILDNPLIFGKTFYVIEGFPGFEYKDYFTNATWGLPRIAYHTLAAEITFARDLNAKAELATQSVIEKERKRVTRKTGFKRPFTAFESEEIGGPRASEFNSDSVDVDSEV